MTDDVVPCDHILRLLSERAAKRGHDVAVSFVADSKGSRTQLTWAELRRCALAARSTLKRHGLRRGDRLLVSLPAGKEHLATILGALWCGVVPATAHISPQTGRSNGEDWRGLVETLRPSAIVTGANIDCADILVLHSDEILAAAGSQPEADDFTDVQSLTYVQFTSGSTGRPKGVCLEWDAIARNLKAIGRAAFVTPEDHAVTWLPMYHDMGWFGGVLAALYAGCRLTVMDVGLFVLNPLLWIRLIEDSRATITVTPPSALKTSLDLLKRRPLRQLDLSSLRQIICGAEPISPQLIHYFREVLVPYGVPETALKPVYGLAEATLAVTFPPRCRVPRIDRVIRRRLERDDVAEPAAPGETEGSVEQVSVGTPLDGVTVAIFDDSGRRLDERMVGRVKVRSPSAMAAVMQSGSPLPWSEPWLDTGDLGYVADDELYITGRSKDLIVKFGEKFSPDRLEEVVSNQRGVRRAVAFGVFDEDLLTERVVVIVEPRAAKNAGASRRDAMRLAIRADVQASGYSVDSIVFVRKGTLPLTTSGKIRRGRCREMFCSGDLDALEEA